LPDAKLNLLYGQHTLTFAFVAFMAAREKEAASKLSLTILILTAGHVVIFGYLLMTGIQDFPQAGPPLIVNSVLTVLFFFSEGVSMRLAILDSGHGFWTKVTFAFIRAVSCLPVPDAIKLNRYRPDFYGTPMRTLTQEAMRGPSGWSVGDRELMGASVSKMNECECCTKTHAAVAALAYQDAAKVSAALSDPETEAIEKPLRATLRMLRKLTREHAVDADDMRALLATGVSREQIEDALAVCFTFNTVDRLSRTFDFFVPGPKAFEAGAKFLLTRGYR
jgi:alkylhydroperoxidase family enzyme